MKPIHTFLLLMMLGIYCAVTPAYSQATRSAGFGDRLEGTVVSLTDTTMVVRTESGDFQLFVFDANAERPHDIRTGSRVEVESTASERDVRTAHRISLISGDTRRSPNQPATDRPAQNRGNEPNAGAAAGPQNRATPAGGADSNREAIPPEVRRLERQIERQARRFRAGVQAGAGFDPEILIGGVHAQLGPIFNENVTIRPSAEFGLGEISTFAAINLEALYRLPLTPREGTWSAYAGAGPGFNFIDQNFEAVENGRDIDFDDFDFDPSLNFIAGVESRGGWFIELKAATFGRPHTRLMVGVHF